MLVETRECTVMTVCAWLCVFLLLLLLPGCAVVLGICCTSLKLCEVWIQAEVQTCVAGHFVTFLLTSGCLVMKMLQTARQIC